MKKSNIRVGAVTLISLALAAVCANATLIIKNEGFAANNQTLPGHPNYASNVSSNSGNWDVSEGDWGVTGAPDIGLTWDGQGGGNSGTGLDTYTAWDGRGGVVQLDSGNTGGTKYWFISFTPTLTTGVKISSFDLDIWDGKNPTFDHTVDWYIRNATQDGSVLTSGSWTGSPGDRETVSADYEGSLGQTLVLELHQSDGTNIDKLAMDNLTIDQIPEPASMSLAALSGLVLLACRRFFSL